MTADLRGAPLLVVGAGIMGAGIAQVAAQAGHAVWLYDLRPGAAEAAKAQLAVTLQGLVTKGRINLQDAEQALARIEPLAALEAAAGASLVIEAVVEDLAVKRALFQQVEALVADGCVMATNTSSISVTAIALGLRNPARVVGMHFFNPVPVMKLVEVVSGLQTDPAVADAIEALSRAWGKTPVRARSTPGFIVNRIARPYYAETLALLQEQAAAPQVLDASLRAAGFRMGPCELMDLIGHDTNFAVTNSVFEANFQDKRYAPSLVQREMVDGGLLGRKSGRGFFSYPAGAPPLSAAEPPLPADARDELEGVAVHGSGPHADALARALERTLALEPGRCVRDLTSDWTGLRRADAALVMTDGQTAEEWATAMGLEQVAVFDRFDLSSGPQGPARGEGQGALAYAVAQLPALRSDAWDAQARMWLRALGFTPLRVADTPGLAVARTLAMLINEAADAVLQGVCTADGADWAMKLGVNYPRGPFEWLADWSETGVVDLLDRLDAHYRGERYRVSPWLRQRSRVSLRQRAQATRTTS